MLFKDFPHTNTLISNKGKLIIKKELDNKDILNKEYQVLKFLEKYKFTPKVWGLSATGYFEEFINGNKLSTKDLTIDNLKKLARSLNTLHSIKPPTPIIKLVTDKYIKDIYKPSVIFKALTKNNKKCLKAELFKKIFIIMLEMNRYFKNKKCHLGLVHGDLSFNNIMLSTNKIYIIDWSDCRYDVLSADISQLFYLCKFNKKQKGIFLKNYSACYIDNKILLSHYILLLVYDIIDYYNKNNKIYISKNKELEKIIKDYAN